MGSIKEYVVNIVMQGVAYPQALLVGWVGCYEVLRRYLYDLDTS